MTRMASRRAWLAALLMCGAAHAQQIEIDPENEVEVLYDDQRTPHIFPVAALDDAHRDRAAFYALGYTQVRDFPIKTVDNILVNAGRGSELWGDIGGYLAFDTTIRHLEVRERAQDYIDSAPAILPMLEAYVEGVSAARAWWRASETTGGPARFRSLYGGTGFDVDLYVDPVPAGLAAYGNNGKLEAALEHFFLENCPENCPEDCMEDCMEDCLVDCLIVKVIDVVAAGLTLSAGLFVERPIPGVGSNAWVGRTANGVYTMNDSHLPTDTGYISPYFVQMEGGSYNATGWTIPGFPCVVVGFNQDVSWATTVGGVGPLPSFAPINGGHTPVVSNVWKANVDETGMSFPYGSSSLSVNSVAKTWFKWTPTEDPEECDYEHVTRTFWYAEDEPGAVTEHYPMILSNGSPRLSQPDPDETIYFQQYAVLSGPPAWEFFIGMGQAESVGNVRDRVEDTQYGFGGALNLLVADRSGELEYTYMARVPIQGTNACAEEKWALPELYELDGSDPLQRWTGFHVGSDLPRYTSTATGSQPWSNPEVLINCNVSPHVTIDAFSASGIPSYMLEDFEFDTWRQERAKDLLDSTSVSADSLDAARDVVERYMVALWPYFAAVGDVVNDPVLALIEGDTAGGTDFSATVDSKATPFVVLLLSYYETKIREAYLASDITDDDQLRFGFDPSFSLPSPTVFENDMAWDPNRQAIAGAIDDANAVLAQGSYNPGYFAYLNGMLTSSNAVTPAPWTGLVDGPLRWGLVNQLVLTPHFFTSVPDGGPIDFLLFYLSNFVAPAVTGCPALFSAAATAFYPAANVGLEVGVLEYPYYTDQRVAAYPMPGTQYGTLFSASPALGVGGYDNALYGECGTPLFLASMEVGSIVPFNVEISGTNPPVAHYMSLAGSTSMTRDVANTLMLDDDERWFPTSDFAARTWTLLETDYATLSMSPMHMLELVVP